MQMYISLIQFSFEATGWLAQLARKADAKGVGIYLPQKRLFSWDEEELDKRAKCMLSGHARTKHNDALSPCMPDDCS